MEAAELSLQQSAGSSERILERLEAVDYDVFRHRPTLGKADWLVLAWRALRMVRGRS